MFFSIEEIDRLINEDVPYMDLTSWMLGIGNEKGKISFFTREDIIISGTEEVKMIFDRLAIHTVYMVPSGTKVETGGELVTGLGEAKQLHIAWKVSQNILDHCSAIATKSCKMVSEARKVNPRISIFTTRKGFPGTKKLSVKAIMSGGAVPHRLGISETILIFKHHMNFIGGFNSFIAKLPIIKSESCEKKIIVEAENIKEAMLLCKAGVDGVQFDKLLPVQLKEAVQQIKSQYAHVTLLAAGGIHEGNVADYAATMVDGIVTTSLYCAKPVDIGARIDRLDN